MAVMASSTESQDEGRVPLHLTSVAGDWAATKEASEIWCCGAWLGGGAVIYQGAGSMLTTCMRVIRNNVAPDEKYTLLDSCRLPLTASVGLLSSSQPAVRFWELSSHLARQQD